MLLLHTAHGQLNAKYAKAYPEGSHSGKGSLCRSDSQEDMQVKAVYVGQSVRRRSVKQRPQSVGLFVSGEVTNLHASFCFNSNVDVMLCRDWWNQDHQYGNPGLFLLHYSAPTGLCPFAGFAAVRPYIFQLLKTAFFLIYLVAYTGFVRYIQAPTFGAALWYVAMRAARFKSPFTFAIASPVCHVCCRCCTRVPFHYPVSLSSWKCLFS